ncbi:MAG TPA: GNAT family N-acetyltransferase [Alphaproteobacteria bacterium]|nr:GNAT family N-acetyltransferase [Alphaproteobacteria bacterium]
MSTALRVARPEDRDAVVELLHTHMSARIPRERWALLFDYPWRPEDAPDCGRILEDAGRIVGYLGATYVDREFAGKTARICNMSSWYLLRSYRGQGYGRAMVQDLTSDPAVTYTDFTATAQVHSLLLAHAGFAILDQERWVLGYPGKTVRNAQIHRLSPPSPPLSHHCNLYDLHMVQAQTDEGICSLVFQVKKKGDDISYHQLLYADDPGFLARNAVAIAAALLPDETAVMAIDRRLAPVQPSNSVIEQIAQPRLYKSRRLRPDQIDNLYNEVLLLDQKLP